MKAVFTVFFKVKKYFSFDFFKYIDLIRIVSWCREMVLRPARSTTQLTG